mgnify:CR=1 FL=1
MVWRTAYSNASATDVDPPGIGVSPLSGGPLVGLNDPGIWIVGFGVSSFSSIEVWLRLCRSDLPDFEPFRVVLVVDDAQEAGLSDLIPPSRLPATFTSTDSEAWVRWAGAEPPLVLAALSNGRNWPLAIAGRPTEEAWDAFCAAARRQQTPAS